MKRPAGQQVIMFHDPGPEAMGHLNQLVEERRLLRYQTSGPEVNLDEVVENSRRVKQLLQLAAHNRIALIDGLDDEGMYHFELPAESPDGRYGEIHFRIQLETPPDLSDFADAPGRRSKR